MAAVFSSLNYIHTLQAATKFKCLAKNIVHILLSFNCFTPLCNAVVDEFILQKYMIKNGGVYINIVVNQGFGVLKVNLRDLANLTISLDK